MPRQVIRFESIDLGRLDTLGLVLVQPMMEALSSYDGESCAVHLLVCCEVDRPTVLTLDELKFGAVAEHIMAFFFISQFARVHVEVVQKMLDLLNSLLRGALITLLLGPEDEVLFCHSHVEGIEVLSAI